jgi:uncharacterized protein involved in exopolysaccharide biosynthesis
VDEYVVEQPVDGSPAPVDPRRALLLPIWRGRYIVLAATLLGIVGGLTAGVTRPNTYRSFGKLMIRAGAREELTPEMVTGNGAGFGGGGRNVVNDELHLLGAVQVFEETARIVTPAEVFRPYDPTLMDDKDTSGVLSVFHGWQSWWFKNASGPDDLPKHPIDECPQCRHAAAIALERNLGLQAEPGSNVITVSYTTHDPQLAQKVVAAFLEAAVQHHRKVYETGTALEYLSGHMERYLQDLTSAENDFTNFETECGVYDFATQQQALLTSIHALEEQTQQDQAHLEELRARTQELDSQVAKMPATTEETIEHNVQANPQRGILQTRIFTLQDNLAELERQVVGTSDAREATRKSLTQQLENTKQELKQQPEVVDAGPAVRTVPNARRVRLVQQLDDGRQELTALEASAAVRSGQLVEQRGHLQQIATCGPRFNSLREKVNLARSNYEKFRAEHERTSLIGSMDQLGMSNLRRIQEASLPDEKEGPSRGKLLVLGLLLGAVAGCGLAFVRHMLDHRLHDAKEVELLLGSTVLGVFPNVQPDSRSATRASRSAAL